MPRGPDPADKSEEIVQALKEYERPFMGTGELADVLGYDSNPGVKPHLDRAETAGKIEKTTISGYNIWFLPNLHPEPSEAPTSEREPAAYSLGIVNILLFGATALLVALGSLVYGFGIPDVTPSLLVGGIIAVLVLFHILFLFALLGGHFGWKIQLSWEAAHD